MFLLPRHLQRLFKKKKRTNKRGFASEIAAPELDRSDNDVLELEVFPTDPSIRRIWFSLTIREREVVALICMGYRNYDIAKMLGIANGTIQTHLQNIFYKFRLRSRGKIRAALVSWLAEEWWYAHH